MIALIDADDRHHRPLRSAFETDSASWILPWAILPEVDYLLATRVGALAQEAFLSDLATGLYAVEWGDDADLGRANALCEQYRDLRLGLVDGVVMAMAERLEGSAIATLDLRHFGAVSLRGAPKLLPRDI